jgi:hypothetical protein
MVITKEGNDFVVKKSANVAILYVILVYSLGIWARKAIVI